MTTGSDAARMRFTLRQLEYFVAAGDSGSVRLAAERVSISQASVSAAIAHLEEEFGVQLFVRHHAQGLSLTPQGERLLRESRALLAHAEEISAVASELSEGVAGSLAVGFLVTVAPLLIPEIVRGFGAAHERVRLEAIEDHHRGLMDGLRHGKLSAAIPYDLDVPPEAAFEPLVALPPYVLLAADHRFAGRASLSLAGSPLAYVPLESHYRPLTLGTPPSKAPASRALSWHSRTIAEPTSMRGTSPA